jgi:hypothetical protein
MEWARVVSVNVEVKRIHRNIDEQLAIMYGPPPDCERFEVERSNESA